MTSETVWVVDDDPIFRMIFSMTLKKCYPEFQIEEFSDGIDACNRFKEKLKLKEQMPQSIFMDINMPVMNGWECMDRIQELIAGNKEYKTQLYIVSSSINPEDKKRANSYEVSSGYLVKPITIEVFKEIFK